MRAWDLRRRAGAVSDGRGRAQHQRSTRIKARKRSMRPNARSCSRPDTKRERVPTVRPKPLRPHPPSRAACPLPASDQRTALLLFASRRPCIRLRRQHRRRVLRRRRRAGSVDVHSTLHPRRTRATARVPSYSPLSPPPSSALVPPRRDPRLDLFPHPFSAAARQAEIARHAVRARPVAPAAASGHTPRAACGARSAPREKQTSDRQNSTLPDKSRKNVGNVRSAGIVWKATMEVPSATTSGDACSVEEEQRGDDEEGVVAHFNTGAAAAQAAGSAAAVNSRVDTFARSLARACERATQARRGRRPLPANTSGFAYISRCAPVVSRDVAKTQPQGWYSQ